MSCGKLVFTKPALSIPDQAALLQSRGLSIPDPARVQRYLSFIGYYRLAIYGQPYQVHGDPGHHFQPGVSFDDVLRLYIFDRELRLHVMDAVERIEVALRTVINNHMALKYGAMWYTEARLFDAKFDHADLMNRIRVETGAPGSGRNGDAFCIAYYKKYCAPSLPPCWMVGEVLSMGTWSRIFQGIKDRADRIAIADTIGIMSPTLISWLRAVPYTRNICAHHGLLWNRTFTIKPRLEGPLAGIPITHFYAQALVIKQLIGRLTTASRWKDRLKNLVDACPRPIIEMGFPAAWWTSPIWTKPQ